MRKYYYSIGKDRVGPVTIDELKSVEALRPGTLVWYQGLSTWTRASELPELSEFFIAEPPPLPGAEPPPLPKVARATPHAVRSLLRQVSIKRSYLFVGIALVSVLLLSAIVYYFVFSGRLYSGGRGTEKKPYLISSLADMELLSANVNVGHTYVDTCFLLTRDLIEAGDTVRAVISSVAHPFFGTFDGGDHSIAVSIDVRASEMDYPHSGLFGKGVAIIKNLIVVGEAVGTAERPYLISSRSDMEVLAANVNTGHRCSGACFLLTRDLTESDDIVRTVIGNACYEVEEWEGKYGYSSFRGTFDGGGHSITVDINVSGNDAGKGGEYHAGIFGNAYGATIKNLSVSGRISATSPQSYSYGSGIYRSYAGGICGSFFEGRIINCHNSAEIHSSCPSYAPSGGICGVSEDSEIVDCRNAGRISAEGYAMSGGIVGENRSSNMSDCHNSGFVAAGGTNIFAGGICGIHNQSRGSSSRSTITRCSNRGSSTATGKRSAHVGGIVGKIDMCDISDCYNRGEISAKIVGGIIRNQLEYWNSKAFCAGGITGLAGDNCVITNCYNTGDVMSSERAGGISGCLGEMIKSCFAANARILSAAYVPWRGKYMVHPSGRLVGHFYGREYPRAENSYALSSMIMDGQPCRFCDPSEYYTAEREGIPAGASDFKSQSWIEKHLSWDFTIWSMGAGTDYPILRSEVAH